MTLEYLVNVKNELGNLMYWVAEDKRIINGLAKGKWKNKRSRLWMHNDKAWK